MDQKLHDERYTFVNKYKVARKYPNIWHKYNLNYESNIVLVNCLRELPVFILKLYVTLFPIGLETELVLITEL